MIEYDFITSVFFFKLLFRVKKIFKHKKDVNVTCFTAGYFIAGEIIVNISKI